MSKKVPITSVNYWIKRLDLKVKINRSARKVNVNGREFTFEDFVDKAKNDKLC